MSGASERASGRASGPVLMSQLQADLNHRGMGGRDVQIPPVFYRTSSPPVPSGADAQKGSFVRKNILGFSSNMIIT